MIKLERPKAEEEGQEAGQILKLDFGDFASAMEKRDEALLTRLVEKLRPMVEKPAKGIGFVEGYKDSQAKVLESLQEIDSSNWKMQEEWTVAIPGYHDRELRAQRA
ncbi:unnamed protein product, partial [marine sediment metagenome]